MESRVDGFISAFRVAATQAVSHGLDMTLELKGGQVVAGKAEQVGADYENVEGTWLDPPAMRTGRPAVTLTVGGTSVLAEEVRAFEVRLPSGS